MTMEIVSEQYLIFQVGWQLENINMSPSTFASVRIILLVPHVDNAQ